MIASGHWVSNLLGPEFQGILFAMSETSTLAPPKDSRIAPRRRVPPLLPVIAPIVAASVVIGFVFSRYLSAFAPTEIAPVAHFTDVTAESGVAFVHEAGNNAEQLAPTTLGSGVGVIDFDGDGAPDLFFVNGAPWPWMDIWPARRPPCALYRNDGHGHFTDVTARAGAGLSVQGMGVAIGDYDNDGHPDIFVTAVGQNHLLHNRGDGTFEDVSEAAGVAGDDQTWSTGALWFDIDGDGKLDLIVCRYARWPSEMDLDLAFRTAGAGRSYGAPTGFYSASPLVYRNLGDGHFVEVAAASGLANISPDTGRARAEPISVFALDANGDGKLDLLFLYHSGEPTLFLNEGGGHFREWAPPENRWEGGAGIVALNAMPLPRAFGPLDALAALRHLDRSAGLSTQLSLPTKLGVAFLDYDLDGRTDIFAAGGRAELDLGKLETERNFTAPPQLWWNRGNGWIEAPVPSAATWTTPLVARGVATADFDGDGDLDLVVTQNGGPAKLLRNDQHSGAAWLRIQLVGTKSPRDGTGARVEVHTPRHTLVALAAPAMGYLSQSENVLTFGLGDDARVRHITVLWPSGIRQDIVPTGLNQKIVVTEPVQ